jgi:hypothetical protein
MPSATALSPSRTFCWSPALRVEGWMLIFIVLMVPPVREWRLVVLTHRGAVVHADIKVFGSKA